MRTILIILLLPYVVRGTDMVDVPTALAHTKYFAATHEDEQKSCLIAQIPLSTGSTVYHIATLPKSAPALFDGLAFEEPNVTSYFALQNLMRLIKVHRAETKAEQRAAIAELYDVEAYRNVFKKFAAVVGDCPKHTHNGRHNPNYLTLPEANAEGLAAIREALEDQSALCRKNRLSLVDGLTSQYLLLNPFATPDGNALGHLYQQLEQPDDVLHGIVFKTPGDALGILVHRSGAHTGYYVMDPFSSNDRIQKPASPSAEHDPLAFIKEIIEVRKAVQALRHYDPAQE